MLFMLFLPATKTVTDYLFLRYWILDTNSFFFKFVSA